MSVYQGDSYEKRPVLSATIHPDLKRTLVAMSERTGMSVSQVTDEVLYAGLVEMQELWGGGGSAMAPPRNTWDSGPQKQFQKEKLNNQ